VADAEELLTTRIAQIIAETKGAVKAEEENPETFAVEEVEEDEGTAMNATTHYEPQRLEVVGNHPVKILMEQAPPVITRLEMP
jgi:hypothetical protein